MIDWKKDFDIYIGSAHGIDFIVEKTYAMPSIPIPRSQKWSLEARADSFHLCVCMPTRKACFAAAERLASGLPALVDGQ